MNVPDEIVHALGGRPPTPQQWAAIEAPAAPCSIVAGAGSGKTAVMAARLVHLALVAAGRIPSRDPSSGASPSEVLCLTFTNKAAAELSRRVAAAVRRLRLDEGDEPTVLTYHAFAATLLDEYGLRLGVEPGSMLLSAAQRWQIAVSLFEDRTFEHLEIRSVAYPVRQLLELADQCANHLVDPRRLAAFSREFAARDDVKREDERIVYLKRAELAELVEAYRDRKRAIGAIDYGDQIELAVRLVREHPAVVHDLRSRFRVVLLDEYQDTNHAQGALLAQILGRDFPVTCVGDPDQNIYAWRGASLRNILEFNDDFGGSSLPLTTNFRSGSRILDVANAVIKPVPEERRAPDKRLDPWPERGEGEVLAFVESDEAAEGARIAAMIVEAAANGTPLREIAVLCRKKRLMEPIRRALTDAGIPVEVADLGGLLRVPEIVDLVAWLRILDDPARNVALTRLLQGPRWRIGYRDIVALARWSARENRTLREALDEAEHPGDVAFALVESLDHLDDPEMTGLSPEAHRRLTEFRALVERLRAVCVGPLDELVTTIAEETGLFAELESAATPAAESALRNVLNFIAAVSAFAPVEGDATLSTLVTFLDAADDSEAEDFEQAQLSDAESVKMLTIHKAKGLEWDVVFVPGLAVGKRSKIFPDVDRQPNPVRTPQTLPFELRGDADVLPVYEGNFTRFRDELKDRALEEERRLCYVALTRARKRLVVSCAHWYDGPQDPYTPGLFYREIAEHQSCEEVHVAEKPDVNPIVEQRLARVPSWPLPAADASLAAMLAGDDGIADDVLVAALRARPATREPAVPAMLSVSALATFRRCPRRFYDTYVRPLPRQPSEAARLGTEVHRAIEYAATGRGATLDRDDEPTQPTPPVSEGSAGRRTADDLVRTWRASRFADPPATYTELPFALVDGDRIVGGRIDAIFDRGDVWEIVDYKTGESKDEAEWAEQLGLYRRAWRELKGVPDDAIATLVYTVSTDEEIRIEPADTPLPDIESSDFACTCGECEAGGPDA